jgi:hypothetical protein
MDFFDFLCKNLNLDDKRAYAHLSPKFGVKHGESH